ncbi:MAG: hypothetical protein V3S64_16430 [bacterium]
MALFSTALAYVVYFRNLSTAALPSPKAPQPCVFLPHPTAISGMRPRFYVFRLKAGLSC